jgi:predicted nuclease of predicted toxin-antitoxin system
MRSCRRRSLGYLLNRSFAEHVNDIGLGDATDRTLWRYAIEHVSVLVTKDEDFSDMLLLSGSSPVVVWIRVGNTRRQALLRVVRGADRPHRRADGCGEPAYRAALIRVRLSDGTASDDG